VDALVRRMNDGDIVIPTFGFSVNDSNNIQGFQRNYVWTKPKSDRFIESLLIGLPVPGIFLVRDTENKLLVLDGQQRLRTLQKFYKSSKGQEKYKLGNVHSQFKDKSYQELDPSDRRRLDDSIIHATIVRQDKPTDDQSSIYDIFERLNTGGVNLRPQEIRVALYHGKFVQLLIQLNHDVSWRTLYGNPSNRLKDLEMILRFFAFYYNGDKYSRPMKKFLNEYMGENRDLSRQCEEELKSLFTETVSFLNNNVGKSAFRPEGSLNAAVMDSVMTGLAKRLQRGDIREIDSVQHEINELFKDENYLLAVKTGTSNEEKVRRRHKLACEIFSKIK